MATAIPVAIQLANGRTLPTPDPATDGVQTIQNDGTNEPRWVAAGASTGIQVLTSDPFPPVDGTAWVVVTGVSPAASMALKARTSGTTHVIASITF
jgi:hypothetical protein